MSKYLLSDGDVKAWKDAAKAGAADREAIVVHAGGQMVGEGKATRDAVAKFLDRAPVDIKDAAMAEVKDADTLIPMIMSDETEDRGRDVLKSTGWDLKHFRKNPVMLFGHNHAIPAIGTWLGAHVDGKSLVGVMKFADDDVNPFGAMIGRSYAARVMRMSSVGFMGKSWSFNEDRGPYAMDFDEQELVECSAVNVGSNRNALVEMRSAGIDINPALTLIERSLDGEDLLRTARPELEAMWKSLRGEKTFTIDALKSAVEEERTARVKAEREAARAAKPAAVAVVDIIDWAGVATDLAKMVPQESLSTIMRARTFAASEKDAADVEIAQSKKEAEALATEAPAEPVAEPAAPVVGTETDACNGAPELTLAALRAALNEAAGLGGEAQ